MRTPRIFLQSTITPGVDQYIEGQAAHHLIKVLRCRVGDPVILFNGDGKDYAGEILSTGKGSLVVHLVAVHRVDNESSLSIHLGIPLAKGQRMDYAIQKAVELGVAEITPLTTARTVVKLDEKRLQGKQEHWKQVAISACEQSGRARIPLFHATRTLADWSKSAETGIVLDPRNARSPAALPRPEGTVHLAAGPEGGLTDEEIAMLETNGFNAIRLGPRILRTETAPLAALSMLQFLWGDFS